MTAGGPRDCDKLIGPKPTPGFHTQRQWVLAGLTLVSLMMLFNLGIILQIQTNFVFSHGTCLLSNSSRWGDTGENAQIQCVLEHSRIVEGAASVLTTTYHSSPLGPNEKEKCQEMEGTRVECGWLDPDETWAKSVVDTNQLMLTILLITHSAIVVLGVPVTISHILRFFPRFRRMIKGDAAGLAVSADIEDGWLWADRYRMGFIIILGICVIGSLATLIMVATQTDPIMILSLSGTTLLMQPLGIYTAFPHRWLHIEPGIGFKVVDEYCHWKKPISSDWVDIMEAQTEEWDSTNSNHFSCKTCTLEPKKKFEVFAVFRTTRPRTALGLHGHSLDYWKRALMLTTGADTVVSLHREI